MIEFALDRSLDDDESGLDAVGLGAAGFEAPAGRSVVQSWRELWGRQHWDAAGNHSAVGKTTFMGEEE
jgi:hypothetical protein